MLAARCRDGEQAGVASDGGEHQEEQGPKSDFRAQVERGDGGVATQ